MISADLYYMYINIKCLIKHSFPKQSFALIYLSVSDLHDPVLLYFSIGTIDHHNVS